MKVKKTIGALMLFIGSCLSACDGHHDTTQPSQTSSTKVGVQPGCYSATYSGYGSSQVGCGLLPSFGDQAFDTAFAQEVALQQNFWTGNPTTVYPFDEC